MRIATWNVEWFAELFDARDNLLADDGPGGREGVSRKVQADAIAQVLARIDADLTVIIEAPNTGHTQRTERALGRFAAAYGLRQSAALIGFANTTHQEIAALYDPSRLSLRHDPLESPRAPRFDQSFEVDTDVDDHAEAHVFSKPPLELELTAPGIAPPLRLIGVHAKSKAPHNANGMARADEVSILNRRKQLAQCIWIRRRVEAMIAAGMPVIVLGDLNDGPGLDHYEHLFGHSSVEVVMGDPAHPETELYDPHANAWRNPRQGFTMGTARFYHRDFQRYVHALLDYVMVSRDILERHRPRWRIWHPFDDPRIHADAPFRDALIAASDHYPVSVDLA
ncbi:endonuclease [Halovulum dunhuangense]|uniref:Endonuclease n=1 Tax=Halovulum dunhuangense TaxID=1505036 RepID=A0A849L558_9RHOB|nr:endonuclease/exonuclease/phosphatase family protein [Halovulum dunhuangense]NNU81496.1 endonuclease [Halovulum dunhuangense]